MSACLALYFCRFLGHRKLIPTFVSWQDEQEAAQRLKKKFKEEHEMEEELLDDEVEDDKDEDKKQAMDVLPHTSDGCAHNDTECKKIKAQERLEGPSKKDAEEHGWFTDSVNYVSDFLGLSDDDDGDDDDDEKDKASEDEEDALTRLNHKYEEEEDKDVEDLVDCEPDDDECLRERKEKEEQEKKHRPVPIHEEWELEAANSSISRNYSARKHRGGEDEEEDDDDWFSQSLNYVSGLFGDLGTSSGASKSEHEQGLADEAQQRAQGDAGLCAAVRVCSYAGA
jgi:hypothetical protein